MLAIGRTLRGGVACLSSRTRRGGGGESRRAVNQRTQCIRQEGNQRPTRESAGAKNKHHDASKQERGKDEEERNWSEEGGTR